jgi:hypothetical protein
LIKRKKEKRTMRLLFRHPEAQAMEQDPKARWRHQEELMLLVMLAPIVVSLPAIPLAAIFQWLLRGLLGFLFVIFLYFAYVMMSWPKARKVEAMRAVAFEPELVPKHLDTIVIGSGSGGSTCSNLLAQSGQRVLVLEQHPTVTGGCTHSFREQNCKS